MAQDQASRALKKRFTILAAVILGVAVLLGAGVSIVAATARVSLLSIRGDSMEPELSNGDAILLKQEVSITQGHLIVFDKPRSWAYEEAGDAPLIKTVYAVAEDTVSFDGESFMVNGIVVSELEDSYDCSAGEVGYTHTLANTEVFALGENQSVSLDSRRIFCDGDVENMYIPYRAMVDYGTIEAKF